MMIGLRSLAETTILRLSAAPLKPYRHRIFWLR
jgi:hypothetical protein